jgi:TRAP transporter TAXI family solute receptor
LPAVRRGVECPFVSESDPSEEPSLGKRLDSWKEIAAYLKRDVATVRRWEKREALPVHRHRHEKLGSVYGFTSELDRWAAGRRQSTEAQQGRRIGRERAVWVAVVAGVVVTLAVLGNQLRKSDTAPSAHTRVRIAVHRPGTVASLIAGGLLDVLNRTLTGVELEAIEEPGMISTLRALDSGQVDLGLAFNLLAFHAVKTDRLLGHRSDAITALTVAYATPAQIVVRNDSNLKAIADLRGRPVSLGIAESGERFCSQIVLSHFGFGEADLSDEFIDFAPSLENLLGGRIDAYISWRGLPIPDVAQAFGTGKLRLIPLEPDSLQGLRVNHPFLIPWTIPARVYPHQDAAVPTVSARILLLASRSLPASLVEQILQAIAGHLPDLIARHPAAAEINVKKAPTLDDGLSVDLHPGAERFFRSHPGS